MTAERDPFQGPYEIDPSTPISFQNRLEGTEPVTGRHRGELVKRVEQALRRRPRKQKRKRSTNKPPGTPHNKR